VTQTVSDNTSQAKFNGLSHSLGELPKSGDHLLFANRELYSIDVPETDLVRCVFVNFGLKKATFQGGRVSHCLFERVYLRHARFKSVDLTGTSFVSCNLRYASFDGSNLSYVAFENCQLDYDNVLQNLPSQPNLKRHLLRWLRLNAASQGDIEEAYLLREELAAERAELYATFMGTNEYFRQRPGRERFQAFQRWCGHQLQKLLWGYGLQVSVLARTALLVVILGAFWVWLGRIPFHCGPSTRPLSFTESFFVSTNSFTTVGSGDIAPTESKGRVLVALESLSGAAFLGLLAATAYRKIAR
jgi:hypothetical protein